MSAAQGVTATVKGPPPPAPFANRAAFLVAYTKNLTAAIERDPSPYAYGIDQVPTVTAKMITALAHGTATLSAAIKKTARELGVRPDPDLHPRLAEQLMARIVFQIGGQANGSF